MQQDDALRPASWPAPASDGARWRWARALGAALVLLLSGFVSQGARADEPAAAPAGATVSATGQPSREELARARLLFQRGVELAMREEYGAAVKRFREALALHPAPAVEYNLASALYEIGGYQEAYNRVQRVLLAADTPEAVRGRAQRLERALQPYVARLTVMTSGDAEKLVIHVDGAPVDPALLGVTQAVTPGSHTIRSERDGAFLSERQVRIPVRTAAIVDVNLVASPEEAARAVVVEESAPAPMPVLAAEPVKNDSLRRKRIVWASVGAAIAAVGVGVGLGILLARPEPEPPEPIPGDAGVLTWE